MSLINYISLFLLLTPIYWFVTDIKFWKIKNYFIFPLLFISITLLFFIEWFFVKENILWIFILIFFWFLFYKNNKWWAGDWKYLILLWINSIIISFLKWYWENIINLLFFNIFIIIFIFNIIFIFYKINEIKKIQFQKIIKFNFLKDFWNIFLIFVWANLIWTYLWNNYLYITIFLFMLLLIPIINQIKSKYFYIFLIISWIFYCVYINNYFWLFIIWIIFFLFSFLQSLFEQIFDIIDIKKIKIYELNNWDIISNKSIKRINNDLKIDFEETPLQGKEVFDIIWYYKKNKNNIDIYIYKDIKLWIIMYIWFFITIFINYIK